MRRRRSQKYSGAKLRAQKTPLRPGTPGAPTVSHGAVKTALSLRSGKPNCGAKDLKRVTMVSDGLISNATTTGDDNEDAVIMEDGACGYGNWAYRRPRAGAARNLRRPPALQPGAGSILFARSGARGFPPQWHRWHRGDQPTEQGHARAHGCQMART